ncbi:alpha/beta fold hydrolase [Halobacillus massiliensis]|uniref:alpha/beta fold hydrolase n=1 Tax=Halobacillus massiliensis TaxID=1926286 RepID=UPI001FE2A4C1|nr:alpha/beta hydrolase [Halobacillus massiliensis]
MLDYKIYNNDENQQYLVLLHGIGGNSNIFVRQLKFYKEHFNVITLHLPGHGNSFGIDKYGNSFSEEAVVEDIIATLDGLNIEKAHFIGVSLGSVMIHYLMKSHPDRVISAVLTGAITEFNFVSKVLLFLGKMIKSITPHLWLYHLFAFIIMPKANHKQSRDTFVREARKMKREDFIGWFDIAHRVGKSYDLVPKLAQKIPKLYVSGSEDHLFLSNLKKDIKQDINASLELIEKCGHVCNIEKYREFNRITLDFLKGNRKHSVKPAKQIS